MQLLEETAAREDLRLDFDLQPGDVQLIHNHTILHARGAFKDFGEAGKRRHLLRTWISPSNGRWGLICAAASNCWHQGPHRAQAEQSLVLS